MAWRGAEAWTASISAQPASAPTEDPARAAAARGPAGADHQGAARAPWWQRHQWLTIVLINLVILAVVLGGAEVFLRYYLPYNAGYYMAFEDTPGVQRFPYGTITYNALGFPDDEFNLATNKRRIGYFGDSVTRGVGVGSGYRISDRLQADYPAYEHWTFGSLREGIDEEGAKKVLELSETYDLDMVIYLFNLNDILPSNRFAQSSGDSWLARIKENLEWLDNLRGASYLYSLIRSQVRLVLAARGYGYQGWIAADLFPAENAITVEQTARRVRRLAEELERRGVAFLTILVPYEMQVSAAAAKKYWDLGVRWDDGFLAGRTQQQLIEHFGDRVDYLDARQAFADPASPAGPSAQIQLGQYFVYNRGDMLDWNHPTRKGHRRIADWIVDQAVLDRLAQTVSLHKPTTWH